MELGVVFPQLEIGQNPSIIREYAETTESLGFEHILAYDHVLGVDPSRSEWSGPYTNADQFHEPLTLFSYLSAVTTHVTFITGVLVLPQRQTALVAKQTAELDIVSEGRLRVGVGVGWNHVEYEALGESFHTRGARIEEQLTVLRELWTEPIIEFEGEFHTLPGVGINPRPTQQPIPIWMGGDAAAVIRRIAHLSDGWVMPSRTLSEAEALLDSLREACRAVDRDFSSLTIHARLDLSSIDSSDISDEIDNWHDIGVDHLALDANSITSDSIDGQLATLEEYHTSF
jgi:probable F420-dependent oxidoreductase